MGDACQVLIYGHPWCLDVLSAIPLDVPAGAPLFELAELSVLCHRFAPGERTVGGGLQTLLYGETPKTMTHGAFELGLASNRSVPIEAVVAGARVVSGPHVLLVHIDHAERFQEVLAAADQVAVWWDLADPPSAAFLTLADVLDREALRGAWRGLHLYQHPSRVADDVDSRLERWRSLLVDYAALVAS